MLDVLRIASGEVKLLVYSDLLRCSWGGVGTALWRTGTRTPSDDKLQLSNEDELIPNPAERSRQSESPAGTMIDVENIFLAPRRTSTPLDLPSGLKRLRQASARWAGDG